MSCCNECDYYDNEEIQDDEYLYDQWIKQMSQKAKDELLKTIYGNSK